MHIRPPQPITPGGAVEGQVHKQRDGDPVPRPFSITRKDLINDGYTPSCPGCLSAANDLRYRPHTAACRKRLEEAMLADELGSNRVKDARAREDAYLEQAVRAADEASKAEASQIPARVEVALDERRSVEPATPIGPAAPATNTSEGMTREDILNENNFHDVVNDDTEMYDAIDSIPLDADGMADQVMAVVQNHVSEVWTPPRMTKLTS